MKFKVKEQKELYSKPTEECTAKKGMQPTSCNTKHAYF